MMNTAVSQEQSVARGVLDSLGDQKIVLALPGTDYKIQMACELPGQKFGDRVGKRIKGTIAAKALRIWRAKGGGRFIEPIWGEPRIIAGIVVAIDDKLNRLLIDAAVPMWFELNAPQRADAFQPGELVNCYVDSGTMFTPA